jgi:hypothetical protein
METKPNIFYILAINAGMWSFLFLLQLKFQKHKYFKFLKISNLRATRQATTYIPTTAQLFDTITYMQVVNLLKCFGVFRPLLGGYSTEKSKIKASDMVDKIMDEIQILEWLKNLKA